MAATPIPSPPLSTSGIWSSRRICHQLTTSLPRYHLKTTSKRVKFQIPEIYVFFFALHMKGFASKCTELKVDFYRTWKIDCRHVCALFSPEIFTGLGSEGVKQTETVYKQYCLICLGMLLPHPKILLQQSESKPVAHEALYKKKRIWKAMSKTWRTSYTLSYILFLLLKSWEHLIWTTEGIKITILQACMHCSLYQIHESFQFADLLW